jgi:hypothetical protein
MLLELALWTLVAVATALIMIHFSDRLLPNFEAPNLSHPDTSATPLSK